MPNQPVHLGGEQKETEAKEVKEVEEVEEDEEGVPVDLRQELHDPLQRKRLLRRRRYL